MSCVSRIDLCPASGDTENVLLQKILQSLNEGGGGVTGLSVNGGPFQTGQVSITTGGGGVDSVNGDLGPAVLLDSGEIPESGNLYFTTARVRATDLTGFSAAAGGAVTAADTILDAFGKLEFRVALDDAKLTGSDRVLRAGDTMTGALLLPAGTSGAPSLSFSGDTNSGIYSAFPDVLSLVAGGLDILALDSIAIAGAVPFRGIAGSAGAPTFSFSTDANTGIYNSAADALGFSTGGVVRLTLSTTSLTSTLPFLVTQGTAAAPAYSFSLDPDTGMFRTVVADTLGFSTGGVVRLTLNTTSLVSTVAISSAVSVTAPVITGTATVTATGGQLIAGGFLVGVFEEDAGTPFGPAVFDFATLVGARVTDVGSAMTADLPSVATYADGRVIIFKDTQGNAAAFPITIDANGADLIDGAGTYVINTNYGSVTLVSVPGRALWSIVAKIV